MADNTISTLTGLYKEKYADKPLELMPKGFKLLELVKLQLGQKAVGDSWHECAMVSSEKGFTYCGTSGSFSTLNAVVPGATLDASVTPYEFVLKSNLSGGAIRRSKNDSAAFMPATKMLLLNMHQSMSRRLEIMMLYGKRNIGVVDAITDSGSDVILTLYKYSFIPGAFVSGATIDIFTSAGTALTDAAAHDLNVSQVSHADFKITVEAVDHAVIAQGDLIFFAGADGDTGTAGSNEFAGFDYIGRNTTTLFGINAGAYPLWKGTVLNNGGTGRDLTFEIIEEAATYAAFKGALDEELVCVVSATGWSSLLSEQAAKRSYDSSFNGRIMTNGSNEIKFFSIVGTIKIIPSIYCKLGSAYILPVADSKRIGSTDITFEDPVNGEVFHPSESSNGVLVKCYTDQALFCGCPGKIVVIDDVHGA